jgi:hypothetical protein
MVGHTKDKLLMDVKALNPEKIAVWGDCLFCIEPRAAAIITSHA